MAVRKYFVQWTGLNTASATLPQGILVSAATVRPNITEWMIGSSATPADNAGKYLWQRSSATGVTGGAAYTPIAVDPADPSSLTTFTANSTLITVGPTLTSNSFIGGQSANQRASWRWVMQPAYGLIAPATAANGLALMCTVTGGAAVNTDYYLYFEE